MIKDKTLSFAMRLNAKSPARFTPTDKNKPENKLDSFNATLTNPKDYGGWDKLTPHQRYEFSTQLYNVQYFNQQLKMPLDDFMQGRLYMPAKLMDAIEQLHYECEEQGLEFNPMRAMLNGLLNYCRNIETKLKKSNPAFDVLPALGVPLETATQSKQKASIAVIKKVFKALLSLSSPVENFSEYMSWYGKEKAPSLGTLKMMAEGKSKVNPWVLSCALTILGLAQSPILQEIEPEVLVDAWMMPLVKAGRFGSSKQAIEQFSFVFPTLTKEKYIGLIKGCVN